MIYIIGLFLWLVMTFFTLYAIKKIDERTKE